MLTITAIIVSHIRIFEKLIVWIVILSDPETMLINTKIITQINKEINQSTDNKINICAKKLSKNVVPIVISWNDPPK